MTELFRDWLDGWCRLYRPDVSRGHAVASGAGAERLKMALACVTETGRRLRAFPDPRAVSDQTLYGRFHYAEVQAELRRIVLGVR